MSRRRKGGFCSKREEGLEGGWAWNLRRDGSLVF